jgi:hypothetical protein
MRRPRRYLSGLLLLLAGFIGPVEAFACLIEAGSKLAPERLVERAAVIVHARARRYCRGAAEECRLLPRDLGAGAGAEGAGPPVSWSSVGLAPDGVIEFDVIRVLKGPALPAVVRIPGKLTQQADFNEQTAPYTSVRRGGRSGNCYAFGYQSGGEFLLFLRPGADAMTPYWAPLHPINEQVLSSEDPWVAWVARQLESRRPAAHRGSSQTSRRH